MLILKINDVQVFLNAASDLIKNHVSALMSVS